VEHLLLCVALLTGIAVVSLDLSSMQFPIAGYHKSRLVLVLLCRLGVCFQVITEICDRLSSIGSVVWTETSGDKYLYCCIVFYIIVCIVLCLLYFIFYFILLFYFIIIVFYVIVCIVLCLLYFIFYFILLLLYFML